MAINRLRDELRIYNGETRARRMPGAIVQYWMVDDDVNIIFEGTALVDRNGECRIDKIVRRRGYLGKIKIRCAGCCKYAVDVRYVWNLGLEDPIAEFDVKHYHVIPD